MSFMKYLESKSGPRVSISLDAYRESLSADISALLIKPTEKIEEVRKISLNQISQTLSELACPFAEEMKISVCSGDTRKISHAQMKFRKWAEYAEADTTLVDRVEQILFEFQSRVYSKEFSPQDVDVAIKTALSLTENILRLMAKNLEPVVPKAAILEAVYQGELVTNIAHVIINDEIAFDYVKTPTGFKTLNENEKYLNIISQLPKSPSGRVVTMYMARPAVERRYFEMVRRDLALGIQAFLPNHIKLQSFPEGLEDVWKVKINEKYLDVNHQIIDEEAPINWLERQT